MNYLDANVKYFGAIDLGSRNCRLLIVAKNGNDLKTVATLSKSVGLGEGVRRTNRLSKKSMDRAILALAQCVKKMQQYSPITFTSVATEACRRATNQTQFLKRVHREIGIELKVINYEEEARYALLGCRELIQPETKYVLIFDIGGGSTEVVWASIEQGLPGRVIDCVSIPYGVVSLSDSFKSEVLVNYNNTREAVETIARDFCNTNQINQIATYSKVQLMATSGITTTISALKQNLRFYDRTKVDGTTLTFDDIQGSIKYIQLMRPEERALHPCIGLNNDDLLLGGLAICDGLYRAWPELQLTVTDRGVRDGMVYALALGEQ